MLLSTVAAALEGVGIPFTLDRDVEISAIDHYSQQVEAGSAFCCIPGGRVDGHDLAADAVAAGAVALVVERPLGLGVPELQVPSVRLALGHLVARFFGDPSHDLTVIGVTGTNGKTTTVSLLHAIFTAAGRSTEVIGTLTSGPSGPPTTPDAPELQERLAAWRDAGVEVVAMEVSSHALAMGRVDGTRFAVAEFTMLGHDHLDLHRDIESYFAAKSRLFEAALTERAVIRSDDPWGQRLIATVDVPVRPFALDDGAPMHKIDGGTRFTWAGRSVELPLIGDHNVANALGAATVASWLGVSDDDIVTGLVSVGTVSGRFELVDAGQPFTVAVDYAHTPDALATALAAARGVAADSGGRVVVVFGCGGDKDRAKRPQMGTIAVESADVVVVTSDNPRSEDPRVIIEEILAGIAPGTDADDETLAERVIVEPDRRNAIALAVAAATPGDVVLIAGKGHETTQSFADLVVPFDDRVVVREVLEA